MSHRPAFDLRLVTLRERICCHATANLVSDLVGAIGGLQTAAAKCKQSGKHPEAAACQQHMADELDAMLLHFLEFHYGDEDDAPPGAPEDTGAN